MAIKNNKKSRKTSRKTSRKPRRKASRKTNRKTSRKPRRKASRKPRRKASRKPRRKASRKPRRKASRKPRRKASRKPRRKASRKPRRKASRKPRRKASRKPRRKASRKPRRKASRKPRRKASRKPRRKTSRKTSRKKFRTGKRKHEGNDGRSAKTQKQELIYGKCRIPRWGKHLGTQMISPLGDSMRRVETCAQYIIHAHGCHTRITNRQVHQNNMENIEVITYAPMGQSLGETCARTWHNYLVRRRPQFINPVFPNKKPPRSSNCRPWVEFSADYPRSEIRVAGDESGQFKSGVLDITDCCNRPSQRRAYDAERRGLPAHIEAPIVMPIEPGKVYRLSDILKSIKAYNDENYPRLKNIFVHLLTCMDDASNCSDGNCRPQETNEQYKKRMEDAQAALHHGWD